MKYLAVKYILLVIAAFVLNSIYAQTDKFPEGAYFSMDEFLQKSPSLTQSFIIKNSNYGRIDLVAGNYYKLKSTDKKLRSRMQKRHTLLYSDGDSLFINGSRYSLPPVYCKILSQGQYLVFFCGFSNNPGLRKKQLENSDLYEFKQTGDGSLKSTKMVKLAHLYAVDTKTNTLIYITPVKLLALMKNHPELLKQFEKEDDQYQNTVLLYYVDQLNKRLQ